MSNVPHGKGMPLPGAGMLPPIEPTPTTPQVEDKKQKVDRFAQINGFIDYTMARLTPSARAVWLILWRDTKTATGHARTSQAHLARRAMVSDRAVRTAIKHLCSVGLLEVLQQGRLGKGPSTYQVIWVPPNSSE